MFAWFGRFRTGCVVARRVSYEMEDGTVVQFETEPVDGWREVGAEEVIARIERGGVAAGGGAQPCWIV